jgi:hypothetical protein
MDHPMERFASDSVFKAPPRDTGTRVTIACRAPAAPVQTVGAPKRSAPPPAAMRAPDRAPDRTPDRAEVLERLVNPRGLGVAPARLVAVVDATLQEALDESPVVLWEAEEVIRFELPDARILLVLSDGAVAGQFGMTLAVVFEGETCHEIAPALARLIARTICQRYPHYETIDSLGPFAQDLIIDSDIDAILAEPLSGTQAALAPIDTLVDQMWRGADARIPPLPVPVPHKPGIWQRLSALLTPPALAPMRQSVRLLALMLFGMGLVQGGHGLSAQAETKDQIKPPVCTTAP